MDDRIFFGILIYLFLAGTISGFLPDDFYRGTKFSQSEAEDFSSQYNETALEPSGQLNFFGKVIAFFFVSWVIQGIPSALGVIISLFNLIVIIVGAIYVYDKIRGI